MQPRGLEVTTLQSGTSGLVCSAREMLLEGMRALLAEFRSLPRREIVKAAVVLVLAMAALDSWRELLAELGGGRFEEAWESVQAVATQALLAWGVIQNPAKWGFRAGLLGAVVLLLVGGVGGVVLWSGQADVEKVAQFIATVDSWSWAMFAAAMLMLAAFTAAALSLRWLFAEPAEPRWSKEAREARVNAG